MESKIIVNTHSLKSFVMTAQHSTSFAEVFGYFLSFNTFLPYWDAVSITTLSSSSCRGSARTQGKC